MDLRELPQGDFTRHPWEVTRAQFFTQVICRRLRGDGAQRVLDIGAGDGYAARCILAALPKGSSIVCVDVNYPDPELERLNATAPEGLSFARTTPDGRFDWLILLDVLEHVDDDFALLRQLSETALRPCGSAIVSVPAWPELYVEHDVVLGHFRRYRPRDLALVMAAAGLQVEERGGLFASLLIPRALSKLAELARGIESKPGAKAPAERAETDAGDWRGGAALTRIVTGALAFDHATGRLMAKAGLTLPGLSVWAVGCKPGSQA